MPAEAAMTYRQKGGGKVEKLERFKRGITAMGADERAALHKALEAAVHLQSPVERAELVGLITDIGAAKGRAMARRESDRRTDRQRRRLVGARVPKLEAERCRRCAELEGVSLYRFMVEAIEAACVRAEAGAGIEHAFDQTEAGGGT